MSALKGEVMDLTKACQNFPPQVDCEVSRDPFIEAIHEHFEKGIQVVFLTGESEVGKTTLVSQFARYRPSTTVSIFLKPSKQLLYDPHLLRLDVCNQLSWALYQEELGDLANIDDSIMKQRIWELQRQAKRENQYYCFAIDGLEGTLPEDLHYVEYLLSNLMFGDYPDIKYLITGEQGIIPNKMLKSMSKSGISIVGFTLGETTQYLKDMVSDSRLVNEFYKLTKYSVN